jgi:hypothetical protein
MPSHDSIIHVLWLYRSQRREGENEGADKKNRRRKGGFLEIKQEHKGETHRRNRGKAPGTDENRDNRRRKTETKNQRRGETNENTGRKPRENEQI